MKSYRNDIESISIIGAGRMGNAISTLCVQAGYNLKTIVDIDVKKAERIQARYRASSAVKGCHEMVEDTDMVFITVPDDAIGSVALDLSRTGQMSIAQGVVHTSGMHSASILSPLRKKDVWINSFHPCFSFPEQFDGSLKGITIAIEGDTTGFTLLERLANRMGANPIRINAETKPLYHAACTMASSGLVALIAVLETLMRHVSGREGLGCILPLIEGTLDHVKKSGVEDALTGPVVRGDVGTVECHLQELKRTAPDVLPLYIDLSRHILSLVEKRSVEDLKISRLRSLLNHPRGI